MDRLIRVDVRDKNGIPLPNSTVSVYVNGTYVGKAVSSSAYGGTFTIQIDNQIASVKLKAEYLNEPSQQTMLSQGTDYWEFIFDNVEVQVPSNKPFWQEHIPGILGVSFLLISIILAIAISEPTVHQRRVFVGALAIALAGIAVEIPGFLNVKLTLGNQLALTAAGAVAIFVLVYFFTPA